MAEEIVNVEMHAGGEAGAVAGQAGGAGAAGAGAAGAGQQQRPAMRWTSVLSGFVLRRMCQLISTGVRTDKGFKEVHLNQVAKALQEFSGNDVTGTQVYNHLRKWRQRWVRVTKLKDLSGAQWDGDNYVISLEEEHYNGHIMAHPKDAEFLNRPIENYQQMEVIFGNGLATGKYAMGSNEALGVASDFAESSMNTEIVDDGKSGKVADDLAKLFAEGPKGCDGAAVGVKRKRSSLSDDDCLVLTGMTAAVNNVAEAIRETKIEDVHPDLYGAVMFMPGFTDDALIVAFSHLVDNKAQGTAFVKMSESHRVLWLRTFLSKHFYM